MSDKDYFEDSVFNKPPDEVAAEAMLKRLEHKEAFKAQESFKESLSNKVWRTKDGRYVDFSKMDDNHLLNSFKLVERNMSKYMIAAGYTTEGVGIWLESMRTNTLTETSDEILLNNAKQLEVALGAQIEGYRFLHEEILSRNLYGKKLQEAADDVFDVFDDIINSKPEEDGTQ